MGSTFDFDAPQFLDLRDIDNVDDYFNVKIMGEEARKVAEEVSSSSDAGRRVTRVVFNHEEKENVGNGVKYSLGQRLKTPVPKKTRDIHDEDEDNLLEKIGNLQIDSSKKKSPSRQPLRATHVFEGITLLPSSEKKHKMVTRADSLTRTPLLKLRSRSIPRTIESDDETDDSMVSAVSSTSAIKAKPQQQLKPPSHSTYGQLKRNSDHFAPSDFQTKPEPCKFVALAEQVANFHKETPDRYRTKPHEKWRPTIFKPALGMPKAPQLASWRRSRPVHFPDRQQREQQEYEEMLKPRSGNSILLEQSEVEPHNYDYWSPPKSPKAPHQIKAHPVNEKILKQPSLGLKVPIEKRPTTSVVPFKLTEYQKPKPVENVPVFQFKAQPVPRKILQSPVGIPPKKIIPATTPKTPAFTHPVRVKAPLSSMRSECSSATGSMESLPRNTRIEPFSFDERDRCMLAKKEENIKKIIEEEKKTFSSFKAQPIRKLNGKVATIGTPISKEVKRTTTPMPFNLTKTKPPSEKTEPEIKMTPFRAKPAIVLTKRPFFPSHETYAPPQTEPFHLKTEVRAEERKKFDEMVLNTEAEVQRMKEKAREEEEKRHLEEVKELRKLAEFKANPIPKTKCFEIQASSIALTQPMSPIFRSGKPKKPSQE